MEPPEAPEVYVLLAELALSERRVTEADLLLDRARGLLDRFQRSLFIPPRTWSQTRAVEPSSTAFPWEWRRWPEMPAWGPVCTAPGLETGIAPAHRADGPCGKSLRRSQAGPQERLMANSIVCWLQSQARGYITLQ